MKRLLIGALVAVSVAGLWVAAVATQSVQCGGSFTPGFNCTIPGFWNFTKTNGLSTPLPTPFQVANVTATGVTSITKDLTNAQVLALGSATGYVQVVPAPGANKYIDVIGVQLAFDYTAAYTGGSDLKLFYTSRYTGPAASGTITASGFIVSVSADRIVRVAGTPDNTPDLAIAVNVPVVIQGVSGAAFGGGNTANAVRVVVHYRVVQVAGTVN